MLQNKTLSALCTQSIPWHASTSNLESVKILKINASVLQIWHGLFSRASV
jgi:hypothetical protein